MTFELIPEDAIAVVGMACRVPGATSPEGLWQNILAKRDLQTKMPADRFNVDAFFHPVGTNKGTTNARYGYFLDQSLRDFDASFFNISRKEAEGMDPQHRLSLEVVYESLQDAAFDLNTIRGTNTSVLVGAFTNDYGLVTNRDLADYSQYTATGNTACLQSNRISFFYGLHGMSLTLDTACSSSLVGLHVGCQTIQSGLSPMSIVVGSALHYDPNFFVSVTDLGMLSVDGRCRAWDVKGSGYVRGDGVCAVVLKNARAALRDGDPIRAIIRGSGSNHDGKKQGITMPNPAAQERLIRQTFQRISLDFQDIQFFEAHGTGTRAGDPRETKAIGRVFSTERTEPLIIGSVKTNIGHLEGASGLAGMIKVIKSLEHRTIAPNMLFEEPNPEVLFDEWKLRVPTEAEPWPQPKPDRPRMACINSFGFGGANAHAILQEVPSAAQISQYRENKSAGLSTAEENASPNPPRVQLLLVSGQSASSAARNAAALADFVEAKAKSLISENVKEGSNEGSTEALRWLQSLAVTLNTRSTGFRQRAFVIAHDLAEAIQGLRDLAATKGNGAGWNTSPAPLTNAPKSRLAFVFTGQGAQHESMGRHLLHYSPLFRQVLERFDEVLQTQIDAAVRPSWSVVDELLRDAPDSRIRETEFSQPLCTAVQMAIVEQLKAWNVTPAAVVGHSSGEVAAAYAAGILSFRDAAIVAYLRGYYMGSKASLTASASEGGVKGGMMAVGLTRAEAEARLVPFAGRLSIACVNSGKSITLSGDIDALQELQKTLTSDKVFARMLQVAQAFHSHHMVPLASGYLASLEHHNIAPCASTTTTMFSSVTARKADWKNMGPSYWVTNMVSCVEFEPALIGTLLDEEENLAVDYLVEIGPHPALKGPCKQVMDANNVSLPYFPSLTRGVNDDAALLTTLGALWSSGAQIGDLTNAAHHMELVPLIPSRNSVTDAPQAKIVADARASRLSELPPYQWDHEAYWLETRAVRNHRLRKYRHNLLGYPLETSIDSIPRWRNFLRLSELPWLKDHQIQGRVIFPASGYLALAIEGAIKHWTYELQNSFPKDVHLFDIEIKSALELEADKHREVMLEMRMVDGIKGHRFAFSIFSFVDEPQQLKATCHEHCTGLLTLETFEARLDPFAPEQEVQSSSASLFDTTEAVMGYYDRLHELGLQYGPHFQLLQGLVESGEGQSQGLLSCQWLSKAMQDPYDACQLHPALLDASFHVLFSAVESQQGRRLTQSFIPTRLESLRFSTTLFAAVMQDAPLRVHSRCEMTSSRNVCAEIDVFDTRSEGHQTPLLTVRNLKCTAVGGLTESPRSLLFRVRQAPCLDLFDSKTEVDAGLPAAYRSLSGLIDLAAHIQSLRLLCFADSMQVLEEVLESLGSVAVQRQRYRYLDVFLPSESEWTEEQRSAIQDRNGGLVRFLDTLPAGEEQYNVIVMADLSASLPSETLSALPTLLSSSGTVIQRALAGSADVGAMLNENHMRLLFQLEAAKLSCWRHASQFDSLVVSNVSKLAVLVPDQCTSECNQILEAIKHIAPTPVQIEVFTPSTISSSSFSSSEAIISLLSLKQPILASPWSQQDQDEFRMMQTQILVPGRNVIWVTSGASLDVASPGQSFIMGMARSARNEVSKLRFVVLDAPVGEMELSAERLASLALRMLDTSITEEEVTYDSFAIPTVPRIVPDDELNKLLPSGNGRIVQSKSLAHETGQKILQFKNLGRWDQMYWAPSPSVKKEVSPSSSEVELRVSSVPLTLSDSAKALEVYTENVNMGDVALGRVLVAGNLAKDAAGSQINTGDTVLALVPKTGTLRTFARATGRLCLKVSSKDDDQPTFSANVIGSVKDATLMVFSVSHVARIRAGEHVLIQSDASSPWRTLLAYKVLEHLGLSASIIVHSEIERGMLLSQDYVRPSSIVGVEAEQDSDAELKLDSTVKFSMLLQLQDLDLHPRTASQLSGSWSPFPVTVLIPARDIDQQEPQLGGAAPAARPSLVHLARQSPELLASSFFEAFRILQSMYSVHQDERSESDIGAFRVSEVAASEIPAQLKMLEQSRARSDYSVPSATPCVVAHLDRQDSLVPVMPPLLLGSEDLFESSKWYVLVGGLGGLGRSLAAWMLRRGAKRLCFISRSGDSRPEARDTVSWLESRDPSVRIKVIKADVTDYAATEAALRSTMYTDQEAERRDVIGGIFHAATLLKDVPLERMSYGQWTDVLGAKAIGAWNLHRATEALNLDLDQFVCLSSAAAQIGGRAQANYSAANAYLDALMQHRRARGKPGAAIDAGMIVGVGLVAEDRDLLAIMKRSGFDPVQEDELLFQAEVAVRESKLPLRTSQGLELHSTISGINLVSNTYFWASNSRLLTLYDNQQDTSSSTNVGAAGANLSLTAVLGQLTEPAEQRDTILAAFMAKVSGVLGIELAKLDASASLSQYGLDSLVAVELRNWFASTVKVDIALFDVLGAASIRALVEKAASAWAALASVASTQQAAAEGAGQNSAASADVTQTGQEAAAASSTNLRPARSSKHGLVAEITEAPMSLCQQRIWTLSNLISDPAKMNLLIVSRLTGEPNAEVMRESLMELQRRNWILRSSFQESDTASIQIVNPEPRDVLSVSDFTTIPDSADREKALEAVLLEDRKRPLDIEEGETMRCRLVRLEEGHSVFELCVHHIVCDAGSTESFIRQLSAIYGAISVGQDLSTVSAPEVQYVDFCQWEQDWLASIEMAPHLSYWKRRLDGCNQVSQLLPMATKQERPEVQSELRNVVYAHLSQAMAVRMRKVGKRESVTQFHLFLATLRAFLYRYTGQEDVTFLMVNGTRPHQDVSDMFGLFLNLSPIRLDMDIDEGQSFSKLLHVVKKACVDAIEHGNAPWEAVLKQAGVRPSRKMFPLSQIAVNYQIYGRFPKHAFHDFTVVDVMPDDMAQPVDLNFEAVLQSDGLALRLEYNADLYGDAESMQIFLDNFCVFLENVCRDHRQPVDEIPTCSERELSWQKQNLWNAGPSISTDVDPYHGRSVVEQVLSYAESTPNAVAIQTDVGSEKRSLTFAELRNAAIALAGQIQKPSGIVAIVSLPSAGLVASMLAAHCSGNGFVVLDPTFAPERLATMVQDSGAHTIIRGHMGSNDSATVTKIRSLLQDAEASKVQSIHLDSVSQLANVASVGDWKPSTLTDDNLPFYMIYTSGSTGKPKGVVLSQRCTRAMLCAMQQRHAFSNTDVFLNQTTGSFDISMVQIFSALCAGGRVAIPDDASRFDPAQLAKFVNERKVTDAFATPTQLAHLLEGAEFDSLFSGNKTMKRVFSGGERLPAALVRKLYKTFGSQLQVVNTWSPSEVVVQTTTGTVSPDVEKDSDVLIGRPIARCRHYICDANLRPVAAGMAGEICVGGPQVGRYLNRPQENARSFPPNPFANNEDKEQGWDRLFRTGDRGHFMRDGQIGFQGRINGDQQVKLRGFRIDLGEIEAVLSQAVDAQGKRLLRQAAVAVQEPSKATSTDDAEANLGDERSLVAFVVPTVACKANEQRIAMASLLKNHLASKLNAYMLPDVFHFMDSLPTTQGGKLARSELKKVSIQAVFARNDVDGLPHVAPSAEEKGSQEPAPAKAVPTFEDVSIQVVDLIRKTLGLQEHIDITADSSFFDLGGNSLLLLRMQSRLQRFFGVKLNLAALFSTPNAAGIAAVIVAAMLANMADQAARTSLALATREHAEKKSTEDHADGPVKLPTPLTTIDYASELKLVKGPSFVVPRSLKDRAPSAEKDANVLFVGGETYIGLHILDGLLTDKNSNFGHVFLLGVSAPNTLDQIVSMARQYQLDFGQPQRLRQLARRVTALSGCLAKKGLGLSELEFDVLAGQIDEIYHCGSEVSLLKSYRDLRTTNVLGTCELVRLATKASAPENPNDSADTGRIVPLHYLSSWSTLHLSTWSDSTRFDASSIAETPSIVNLPRAADFYQPSSTHSGGYFKTRWVAETLLDQAASSGNHSITIFRAPAVIGSTKTGISEPDTDYIRTLVVQMMATRSVPRIDGANAIDLVPVDFVADALRALAVSRRADAGEGKAGYHHLGNPSPLLFADLPKLIDEIEPTGTQASEVELQDFYQALELLESSQPVQTRDSAAASLRHVVAKEFMAKGHVMFGLDSSATLARLAKLGIDAPRGVDKEVLATLIQRSEPQSIA